MPGSSLKVNLILMCCDPYIFFVDDYEHVWVKSEGKSDINVLRSLDSVGTGKLEKKTSKLKGKNIRTKE